MQSYDNRQPPRSNSGVASYLPAPTTATWIYAGIGALVGLLIGLFIAWILWPVQWTNAWPADLSQEARAQYLAAVAEAYVYYGDAGAAEAARNRLFNLNDNLPAYIAQAQKFFVDNPQANSRVYISNLGQLAKALNVQSPDIIQDVPVDATPAAAAAATTQSDVGNSVRAWVNWALMILAALVLVGGGFYVVARLNQRRLATGNGDTLDEGGFEDEPGDAMRPVPANQPNPYMRPIRGATVSTTIPTSVPPRGAPQRQSEDYGFEDDDDFDDDVYTRSTSARALDYRSEDEIFDEPDDDMLADDVLDDPLDDPLDQMNPTYQPQRPGPLAVITDEDLEGDDEQPEASHEDLAPKAAQVSVTAAAGVAATPAPASRAAPPVRTLNTYTFQYQAGIADYDQSRPIIDPESGLQVGDCGMGVNMKNNVIQNNPDNVIALDVWLVDKKAEKSFSSQDRILLSEYVVDHNLESTFTRERPNDPSPIIPQPGTTFQIKGPSLTLDCVITEVSYIKNNAAAGMFQSLSIDMTVRSRT